MTTNPHAFDYLRRDLGNVCTWFARHGEAIDLDDLYAELIAIAGTHPEAIYAITSDFSSQSPTPAGGRTSIYKSTDAGTTWKPDRHSPRGEKTSSTSQRAGQRSSKRQRSSS